MKFKAKLWKTIILLSFAVSLSLAVKAKRGKIKKIMEYTNEDFEDSEKNLGGTEESIVKQSMKNAIGKENIRQKGHKTEIKKHKKKMKEFKKFKRRSNNLLKRLKRAKNRQEYDKMLTGYSKLVKKFKQKFEGCLPPPPPAPLKRKRAPTESRCHSGFRSGWKHGKQWAILITADSSSFGEGMKRVGCLTKWLKSKKDSIYSICALRGAVQGYKKWFRLRTHKDELREYVLKKRLRESAIYENEEYYEKVKEKIKEK